MKDPATSKGKALTALSHTAGPIPVDFGSSAVTGMHCSVVKELREYYGLEKRPVFVNEPYQMLGEIDEDLKEALGVDVDGIYPRSTLFGFANSGEKEWRTPWGQVVRVPSSFVTTKNAKKPLTTSIRPRIQRLALQPRLKFLRRSRISLVLKTYPHLPVVSS